MTMMMMTMTRDSSAKTTIGRKATRVFFAFLVVLLTLSGDNVGVEGAATSGVFQPAVSVTSIASSNHVVRGGGGGVFTNPKKPQQQKQGASSKPQKNKADTSSAVAVTRQEQVDVLQRSTVAAISCVTTWAMAKHLAYVKNPIQAAGLQGLLACAVTAILPRLVGGSSGLPPLVPFCAASFCGAVTGMSAHIGTLSEASLLGLLCSVVYYIFERPNKKLQSGKGGRLGTIAFLANVVYFAIHEPGHRGCASWLVDLFKALGPSTNTVAAVAVAAIVLNMARSTSTRMQQQALSQGSSSQGGKGVVATTSTTSTGVVDLLASTSKVAIIAVLLARLLQPSSNGGGGAITMAAVKTLALALSKLTLPMVAASLVVQKSKPFVILPVALVGLMGGTFVPSLAPPLLLGAFIGMTGLPQFTTFKILQAAVLSAIMLQLGLVPGFGGRLGVLAFVGVNFAL